MRTWSRRRKVFLVVVLLVVVAPIVALLTIKQWLFIALDPGSFDPSKTPAAPDYDDPTAWAALPTTTDDADVFLTELPATDQKTAAADVFYIHPTTFVSKQWNGAIDDPAIIRATARGGTLIQASALNACCAIYAPRYRQANGKAFADPTEHSIRAVEIAFSDVAAAFDAFQKKRGTNRPFILASHSQGSVMASRLLRDKVWNGSARNTLVAAYLIGGPITRQSLGEDIPVCDSPEQWGCVVAWNSRGPRHVDDNMDFKDLDWKSRICVNPLSWKSDEVPVPAAKNEGAVFFDTTKPRLLPQFVDATCKDGKLLISALNKIPDRELKSDILLWVMGPENYHAIDVQLYYVNLRKNAVARVESYLRTHPRQP